MDTPPPTIATHIDDEWTPTHATVHPSAARITLAHTLTPPPEATSLTLTIAGLPPSALATLALSIATPLSPAVIAHVAIPRPTPVPALSVPTLPQWLLPSLATHASSAAASDAAADAVAATLALLAAPSAPPAPVPPVTVAIDVVVPGHQIDLQLAYTTADGAAGWVLAYDARVSLADRTVEIVTLARVHKSAEPSWPPIPLVLRTDPPAYGPHAPSHPAAPPPSADAPPLAWPVGPLALDGGGAAARVELAAMVLDIDVVFHAVPRLDPRAYVHVRATHTGTSALLAGDVCVWEDNSQVGSCTLPDVAPGGAIDLWLGASADVVVAFAPTAVERLPSGRTRVSTKSTVTNGLDDSVLVALADTVPDGPRVAILSPTVAPGDPRVHVDGTTVTWRVHVAAGAALTLPLVYEMP